MYLIVNKEDNRVMATGKNLTIGTNGYPFLEDIQTAFPNFMVNTFETAELPQDFEIDKYCYTEKARFYPNPEWEEPNKYGIPDETVQAIKDDTIMDLIELGVL